MKGGSTSSEVRVLCYHLFFVFHSFTILATTNGQNNIIQLPHSLLPQRLPWKYTLSKLAKRAVQPIWWQKKRKYRCWKLITVYIAGANNFGCGTTLGGGGGLVAISCKNRLPRIRTFSSWSIIWFFFWIVNWKYRLSARIHLGPVRHVSPCCSCN